MTLQQKWESLNETDREWVADTLATYLLREHILECADCTTEYACRDIEPLVCFLESMREKVRYA
jgi:uncharacterized protein YdaL